MKKLSFLTLALASLALFSSCGTKQEAPKPADDVQQVAEGGIFKYTITTDIDAEKDDIKILVAMNSVGGQYPVKYDLDCEGDGDFEYKGLTENGRCIYKRHTGKHHIWVRGEIPAMYLCLRQPYCPMGAQCEEYISHGEPSELDHSSNAIVSIDSWGDVAWKSMDYFAAHCEALEKLPEASPDLRQVTDMSSMFFYAESFNQPIEQWNVSNVENMSYLFSEAKSFNQPLEKWDISNVKYMDGMFWSARSFNQPLDKWDVSKVQSMRRMFLGATSLNYYPKSWIIPADSSEDMFAGTKVEEETKKSPLKTK